MPCRFHKHLIFLVATAGWLAIVAAGSFHLMSYETTSGDGGIPEGRWPSESSVVPDPERANLVLALHPYCYCSRATLDELEQLMAKGRSDVAVHVLFIRPEEFAEGWEQTDLWRRAARIPGVKLYSDERGLLAKEFGARTSGHALLYDADGGLLFSGGMTDARGIAGSGLGRRALEECLGGEHVEDRETAERASTTHARGSSPKGTSRYRGSVRETPVFGCALFGPCGDSACRDSSGRAE
ncbi:MAG: RedB protein [Planctomycetes bacterium]|nr:RedB protein [Planctomycetota bacterium]